MSVATSRASETVSRGNKRAMTRKGAPSAAFRGETACWAVSEALVVEPEATLIGVTSSSATPSWA